MDDAGSGGSGGSGAMTSGGSGGMGGAGMAGSGGAGMAGSGGTGMAGSGGTGGSAMMDGGADAGAMSMLRVVHASSNAPAVDIYPAGSDTAAATNVAFGDATGYLELPPGTYSFDLRAAGSAASTAPAYTTPTVTLAADEKYTVVAAGNFGSSDADDEFRVLPLVEGFDGAAAGNVQLRVVHASFDAPTVDLDVGNDDPASPEVSGLARFADTGAAGIDLPAATALQVGIAAGGATVTAFTTPALTDQDEVFVIAVGEISRVPSESEAFSLLAVMPDSSTAFIRQNPFVYALHASPDAGAVDIFTGDTELVDNASFGDMAQLQVPPGTYTLDFFGGSPGATTRPGGSPAASATTPALAAGGTYLAIATGELGQATFALQAYADAFDPSNTTEAQVEVVHSSADAPAVDIGTVTTTGSIDTPALFSNLAYPGSQAGALSPATVTLGLIGNGGANTTVAEFSNIALAAGDRTFVVAAGKFGAVDAGGIAPFQLIAIDTTTSPPLASWTAASILPD